jgi:hypothetical protein
MTITSLNFKLTNQKKSFDNGSIVSYLCDLSPSDDQDIGLSFRTHLEGDLATNIYSGSILRASYGETDRQVNIEFHQATS